MLRKIGLHHRVPSDDGQRPAGVTTRPTTESFGSSLAGIPHRLSRKSTQRPSLVAGPTRSTIGSQSEPHPSLSHDALGLHLVYDNSDPSGDIIFVHGLGGTAGKTWSWKRDLEYFWPVWLAEEEALSSYRIYTFGYNSNFKSAGTNLNILDFAKDLLFQMLTFSEGLSSAPVGHRTTIFVAHSMGGLVVKKACILGKHDPEFADIISRVHGIIFLGTPHRGAQYAKMLNNILSIAPLGAPPKGYIADLDIISGALRDTNEQFRTICEGFSLVSFFETQKTSFGVTKIYIVEKDSGVLGYPQETSSPLNADHHTICKFKSREDENYVSVKNILKLWASRIRSEGRSPPRTTKPVSSIESTKKIEAVLGVRESTEDDFNTLRGRVMKGTCEWVTRRSEFVGWVNRAGRPGSPRTFWLIGLPAAGKTTLATAVVDHIQFLHEECQYHFFSSGHQVKRTAAYCLRSIASQLAYANEEFREKLVTLHEESGIAFNSQKQNFSVIWEKIFEGILFKMRLQKPLFWVLDAIDEADSPSLLISHLLKIESLTPIKLFLTSRPMKIPSTSVADNSLTTFFLSEGDTNDDIRTYVQRLVRDALPDDQHVQEDIINQVLAKASGSFLWVRLTLETLQHSWHTQDDIREVLNELPKGMESLYRRMLDMVEAQPPRQQLMAKRILTWAVCSWRPLTIAELQVALEPEFKGFVRLEDTIVQICGHFISVNNSKVSLIHITARDFLRSERDDVPPFIDIQHGHEHIATVCLGHLSDPNWRRVFKEVGLSAGEINRKFRTNYLLLAEVDHPFLGYATCYWAYHVSLSPLDSQGLIETLENFFTRYCLSWVEAVALSGNLLYLTNSAKYLKIYAKRRLRKSNLCGPDTPLSLTAPPEDYAVSIRLWAIDFIRIVGKFGPNLVQSPSSVHRLIPPFCPHSSMVGGTYYTGDDHVMSVTGLPSEGWDDCLANVSVGDEIASKVLATDAYFITLTRSSGTVTAWSAETCVRVRIIHHNEYVAHMALNKSRTLLVSAGIQTYRVWDISSGRGLYCLPKTTPSITMAISFGSSDSELVIGLDDCSVTRFDLESSREIGYFNARDPHDHIRGCPRLMSFSPDLKRVAVAWRGKPPLVWDMTTTRHQHPQRCRVRHSTDALYNPDLVVWQTDGNSILILCQNTKLVEWHLYDEKQIEFDHIKARNMTVSQDGNFLLTSDNLGTMSVWTFPRFSLVYRLVNENEFIRDLAFSPDGQRFYDTRGSTCNVWEPDALMRPDENDLTDHSSIGDISVTTEPTILLDESSQSQVTSLAPDSEGKYYCCGREDGTVMIHDLIEGKMLRKVYSHASTSSVIAVAWSRSGRYMISGDDSGRTIAKRLEVKGKDKWAVFPVLDRRLDGPVQQFLFNESETLLLISTSSDDHVWNLKTKKEVCCQEWGMRQSRRWVEHPLDPELLIWIDPAEVRTYSWTKLEHSGAVRTSESAPATPVDISCHGQLDNATPADEHGRLVQWIALAGDKQYLVYETLPDTDHVGTRSSAGLHLEFLSTSELRVEDPHSLTGGCVADLSGQVKRLLGTYQDRIVFLDHDYWLCTWEIGVDVEGVKRHFFLPKDWLNTEALWVAALGPDGTFLCPKHGRVAVVRNGMMF
ncbi:MAG: hypothetical protein M1839_001752 [Geoglossum umbratile]|nr:MAG: hypothetical protein M1839_001752 [Geoglossum umbratile]